jgi:hypothetical protein
VTPNRVQLAEGKTQCRECRALLRLEEAGGPEGSAFRTSTYLSLVEIPTPAPRGIQDHSTAETFAVAIPQENWTESRGGIALGFGLFWSLLAAFFLVVGTVLTVASRWSDLGTLVLPLAFPFGFLAYERLRSVLGPKEVRLSLEGPLLHITPTRRLRRAKAIAPLGNIRRIDVEISDADGTASVKLVLESGAEQLVARDLSEDSAHWLARRLRAAIR